MKTKRIDFDLIKWSQGGYKLVTRDNRNARIICTDGQSTSNRVIIALIKSKNGDCECSARYLISGKQNDDCQNGNDLQLEFHEYEDGDIVTDGKCIAIYKKEDECYCGLDKHGYLFIASSFNSEVITRLATDEEKQILFAALAKEGKRWNAEKKCMEDLKPKCEFKPFDKVLVKDLIGDNWNIAHFSYIDRTDSIYPFMTEFGCFKRCIPYNEETKDLLGTSSDCPEKYKTW